MATKKNASKVEDATPTPEDVLVPETEATPAEESHADEEVQPTPPSEHTVEVASIRPRSSFGTTFYYIDTDRERATKGPNQLKGIIKYMLDHGITSRETAMPGHLIGTNAVEEGYVVTERLTGPVIFAYYVRRMEREFGVEHAKTVHTRSGREMA